MSKELDFATSLARQAGVMMKMNFVGGMAKEWKEDTTPLTVTDTAINELVLKAAQEEYPTYSFIGEEGSREIESEYAWVCDPIDGTVPFSFGYPTFAFSLALTKNGESILGVIYDPIMDRMLTAVKGEGAFMGGKRIAVSEDATLSRQVLIGMNSSRDLQKLRSALSNGDCRLPTLYSCVYGGMLVALGEFGAAIYPYDKAWDAAAVKIIVEEAGGKVTSISGDEQRYDRTINGFVASNGLIHDELVRLLADQ